MSVLPDPGYSNAPMFQPPTISGAARVTQGTNPNDTPTQAQVRQAIALPENLPFTEANVRAYLQSRGFPSDLADKAVATANGTAGSSSVLGMTPVAPRGAAVSPGQRLRPVNPNQPWNEPGQWVDTQTGQVYTGQLASNDPTHLVVGYTRDNPQNTTSYDINTGQKSEAMPHPWRDAGLNALRLFAPSETLGLLSAINGPASALPAAGTPGASTPSLASLIGPAGTLPETGITPAVVGSLAGPEAAAPSLASIIGPAGTIPETGIPPAVVGPLTGPAAAPLFTGGAPTPTEPPPTINTGPGWADIIKKIAPAAAGLTTAALTKPSLAPGQEAMNQSIAALVPYLEQLLKTQVARQTASGPLYDQVLGMAAGQLPNWTKKGGG